MKVNDRKKIVFSILKELAENDYIPTNKDYNISKEDFNRILKTMIKNEFLNEDLILFNILGEVEIDKQIDIVTDNGLSFIEECEAWNIIYSNIKDYEKLLNI